YSQGVAEKRFKAHRPIYGFGVEPSERNHTNRMAIALSILRVLNKTEGRTLMDLGGGEGYIAALARDLLGYESMMVELPQAACDRARELFALPAESQDIHNLPYADNSVDVLVLSEVLEHLRDPFVALREAWRVTKSSLVITTQEAYPWNWERLSRHNLRNPNADHAELNHFHPDDFVALFGENVRFLNPSLIIPMQDETRISEEEAKRLVPELAAEIPFNPGSFGIMVVVDKMENQRPPRISDEELIEGLFSSRVSLPNEDRSSEVPSYNWPQLKQSTRDSDDPFSPMSDSWSQDQREHVLRVQRMFSSSDSLSFLPGFVATGLTLLASILRFALAPGSPVMKLRWAAGNFTMDRFRKLLGD
ncbi:MAG TPA: class I SAM-dependent methyltransferase, partial [Bacteroidetes bacterium]|nr:class I SAM-dependent methyltransferase [Bacteroidota bacterium]HEX05417.1 class I SAM-dependent methyltransferase [Bacteroidota bacterium]